MALVACQSCGRKTPEGAFCEKCGAPMAGGVNPAAAPPQPAAGVADPGSLPSPVVGVVDPGSDRPQRGRLQRSDFSDATHAEPVAGVGDPGAHPASAPRIITIADDGVSVTPVAGVVDPGRSGLDEAGYRRGSAAGVADPGANRPQRGRLQSSDFSDASYSPSDPCAGDCEAVRVELDKLAFCLSDSPGIMRLRVTSLADGLSNLRLGVTFSNGAASSHPQSWKLPHPGQSREFSLSLPPLAPGPYVAELSLAFLRGGVSSRYEANNVEVFVYDKQAGTQRIAESLVVNINNDIKMGHACDLRLSQDAADAVGRLVSNGRIHGLQELLDLLKTGSRAYVPLALYDSGASLPPPPKEAVAQRLTLRSDEGLLHLIAGATITFGKDRRANTVCTRLFEPDGSAVEARNGYVSRRHFTLEIEGFRCVLHDGVAAGDGQFRPSGHGVYWNGSRVQGRMAIPVSGFPAKARITLAGPSGANVVSLDVQARPYNRDECRNCEGRSDHLCHRGEVPCVLLSRPEIRERYLLTWACADLGGLVAACRGVTVGRERGAFSWRSSTGAGWLVPGMSLGGGVRVESFKQHGVKRPEEP